MQACPRWSENQTDWTARQFLPPPWAAPGVLLPGLSAVKGLDHPPGAILARAGQEADAERTSVKVRSLLGINDGTSRTSPSNQS